MAPSGETGSKDASVLGGLFSRLTTMGGTCNSHKVTTKLEGAFKAAPPTVATPSTSGSPDQQGANPPPQGFKARRRGSVSAEVPSVIKAEINSKKVIDKSAEARARIQAAIRHCFLFTELDEEQVQDVVDAMFEKTVSAGETIIREGDEGDNFYVIESGLFSAEKNAREVFRYEGKGSFGELALMASCPRAATVKGVSDGVLWAVDRGTFRHIIVASKMHKRQHYEQVLGAMQIFSGLTAEQRSVIADCLTLETYQEGDCILREGEALATDAKFYLLESGMVECFKTYEGKRKLVKSIGDGGFFGEVALITKHPRAADCVAASAKVKVLTMGRDAFERLMGPVEEILAEKISEYNRINEEHQQGAPKEVGE